MENFALVFTCIGLGFVIRRFSSLPDDAYKAINAWVLYVAIPALSLRYIPEIPWSGEMILPVLGPVCIWCGAWLYVGAYSRRKKLDESTRVALLISCGLGNTAFLGFPLITAFYGVGALSVAIVFDLGTFILFCTVAVATVLNAAGTAGGRVPPSALLKRVFTFPSFIACIFALVVPNFIDISPLNPFLDKLVATVSPMALFSIGLQLQFKDSGKSIGHIGVGLFYKLIICPAMILVLALLMGASGEIARVSVIEAGMAPHITASLLASQFNQNPRLCGLMVGIGILCALVTTPLLWQLVNLLF